MSDEKYAEAFRSKFAQRARLTSVEHGGSDSLLVHDEIV